jgi:hypothetical protein
MYLHATTLWRINLDQNRIIKVFSMDAVLFLPPNLVCTLVVTSNQEGTRFIFQIPLASAC